MRLNEELASRMVSCLLSRKPFWLLSLALIVQFSGCTQTRTEDDDTTNTFVTIDSLHASDTSRGGDLFSDVCVADSMTPTICTFTNDNAIVQIRARPKDLNRISSAVQDIIFTRYRVTYIRTDGRNVPGVDVPYPFDGAATFRVPSDFTQTTREFMIVRLQAKLESPLLEMQGGGGSQVLSVLARVDFFGRDVAGRNLQVTGTLNITFADFAEDN